VARSETAVLLSLAESIADGAAIDWAAAEAHAFPDDQAIVRQLRILADLAVLHRSLPAGSEPAPSLAPVREGLDVPATGSWAHLSLIERLGGGTFGEVYRAWDRHLERDVALKLLRAGKSIDDLDASRITHEGRLLARIRHANVITVYGVDSHDGRVGLWMELVRGVTLEQRILEHGPLSAHEAALIGIDLCRALAAIHAAGLIHRDIKAQNVMREDGGRIVLMDLGTGREAGALGRSAAADLAGTPLYLAPEIFCGTPASEQTDLYSLGVLLYHLVTGAFPVRATTIEQLRDAHKNSEIVRLRDARPNLPTAFVRVVERAIANASDRRYSTAGACEADLVDTLSEFATSGSFRTASRSSIDREPEQQRQQRPAVGRFVMTGVATALLLTIAVGWYAWRPAPAPTRAPAVTVRSIAVLPLVNLSGNPAQEYFADGMTDQLIGTLGQLGGLNVISRTSVMQFKGSKKPLPEIARALNVEAVLEGAVLVLPGPRVDDASDTKRVRITARLIYAGTDSQLWDRTFERVSADVLALQGEIARAVAEGINLQLTSRQEQLLANRPIGDAQRFDAFDLYLKGRAYWNERTQDGLKRSIQYFQEAIDLSPAFARAYAGLADAYNLLGDYGFVPRGESRARAVAAATKALELDGSVAEAYVSLAFIDDDEFRWDAAEERFKRAIALKPGYVTAHHWFASHLVQRARFDDAIAEGTKAVELDPLSIGTNGQLGVIFLYARRYESAIAQLEKTVQMDPSFIRGRTELAKAYLLAGQRDRARREAEMASANGTRDVIALGDIGYVYAITGRRPEARRIAAELIDRHAAGHDGAALAAAIVFAGLGDLNRTFKWLEAARHPLDPQLSAFRVDPRFDAVRTDKRFGKLLATAGLAQ
jgi:TolB-like protein/Flp pilus assembly protein TadD